MIENLPKGKAILYKAVGHLRILVSKGCPGTNTRGYGGTTKGLGKSEVICSFSATWGTMR